MDKSEWAQWLEKARNDPKRGPVYIRGVLEILEKNLGDTENNKLWSALESPQDKPSPGDPQQGVGDHCRDDSMAALQGDVMQGTQQSE